MKEYLDKNAGVYHLTERKSLVLVPAIKRHLKKTESGALLDLACGNALFYPLVTQKGYQYFGLDISPVLLNQASKNFPKGKFLLGDATKLSRWYKNKKFDVILCNLLLPALGNKQDIVKIFQECKKVLKPGGEMIFTVIYPSFDMYMRAGILGEKNISTEYKGYFNSGAKFTFAKEFPKGKFNFTDYHWTLTDYFKAIKKAGLKLSELDECPPEKSLEKINRELYKKYINFPGYMIFVCKK